MAAYKLSRNTGFQIYKKRECGSDRPSVRSHLLVKKESLDKDEVPHLSFENTSRSRTGFHFALDV
jgi:hypothetical protein